jgi:hypothetical protein
MGGGIGRVFGRKPAPAAEDDKNQVQVQWKTVAIALIRHYHLHEGIWEVNLQFGSALSIQSQIQATNGEKRLPAAVIPSFGIILKRVEKLTDLAVDASIVNAKTVDDKPTTLVVN